MDAQALFDALPEKERKALIRKVLEQAVAAVMQQHVEALVLEVLATEAPKAVRKMLADGWRVDAWTQKNLLGVVRDKVAAAAEAAVKGADLRVEVSLGPGVKS